MGKYSTKGHIPDLPSNAQLHVGWFNETLPGFLKTHEGQVRFMNVDCDCYSSTRDLLNLLSPRIGPGTILIFDEYTNYLNWQQHEFKAFAEAAAENEWSFEYVGISLQSKQAIIRILG